MNSCLVLCIGKILQRSSTHAFTWTCIKPLQTAFGFGINLSLWAHTSPFPVYSQKCTPAASLAPQQLVFGKYFQGQIIWRFMTLAKGGVISAAPAKRPSLQPELGCCRHHGAGLSQGNLRISPRQTYNKSRFLDFAKFVYTVSCCRPIAGLVWNKMLSCLHTIPTANSQQLTISSIWLSPKILTCCRLNRAKCAG